MACGAALTVLTVLTLFSALVLTLIILVPVRPSRENVISMPSVRRNVCARRSRPASARGFFVHDGPFEMSARACSAHKLKSSDALPLHMARSIMSEPPRVDRRLQLLRRWSHDEADQQQGYTAARARAGRIVVDHEGEHSSRWAAIMSIAAKIGCTAQTLNEWVKKAEVDDGRRAGVPTDFAAKLKALERENRELRQANEILRKASAYFAQAELDRRLKR